MISKIGLDVRVGVFVSVGLALLMLAILLLGGGKALFSKQYPLRAQFYNVQGLNPGSIVSFSGIPVGNISEMYPVEGSNLVEVLFEVENAFQNRITSSSQVEVRTQGALGDKYLYIIPGDLNDPHLEPGDLIQPKEEGDILDALAKGGEGITNLFDVFAEVKVLLQNLNANNGSAELMRNLVASSQELESALRELRILVKGVQGDGDKEGLAQAIERFASILKKMDEGQGTLGALINDPTIHGQLTKILGESPRNQYLKPLIRATIKESDRKR